MKIVVCGLNGVGKSTLGRVLADRLHFHFIDIEDLYFPKVSDWYLYDSPRSRNEVESLYTEQMEIYPNVVFSAVKGDYGENIDLQFDYAVYIDVPKDIRMQRVRERSFTKFAERILPGGDLYDKEENFFKKVSSRDGSFVEDWLNSLKCSIIRVDGTKNIEENTDYIINEIQNKLRI